MKTLRYEFKTSRGFLYDTRETLSDARLHGIGLANDLQMQVTIVAIRFDGISHRYKTVATYKPTRAANQ